MNHISPDEINREIMKELRDIIYAYDRAAALNKKTALATVVHIQGSSYRQPGARMLITEDGMLTGAISGGCLEGDALRKALLVISKGEPMLVTYDTSDEDDEKIGIRLGCNGIIQILIEPIHHQQAANPIELIREMLTNRINAVLLTLFSLEDRKTLLAGTRCLLKKDGSRVYNNDEYAQSADEATPFEDLFIEADRQLAHNISTILQHPSEKHFQVLYSRVAPPISMVIAGGGNDVVPLATIAHTMGWETIIADGRRNYATPARFPFATRLITAGPEKIPGLVHIDERTIFLLMTHNYNYDLSLLKKLLDTRTPYIGILGPRKKTEKLFMDLEAEGITLTNENQSRIFGPTGLDTGAENAEEIALSICAEINIVINRRSGLSLRDRTEPIHIHIN